MASVWISERTRGKSTRHVVSFRVGGRDTRSQYGGSFKSKRLASIRAAAIERDLAELREPVLRIIEKAPARTLREAGSDWLASRIDVSEATLARHRSELHRIDRHGLADRRVDEITPEQVAEWIVALSEDYARGSIRKTKQTLSMILDRERVEPNPARDRQVRLPREEEKDLRVPTAGEIEAVLAHLPERHRLPLLFLDWSGARIGVIDSTLVGDYDRKRQRVRLRNKGGGRYWSEVHPTLAGAIEAQLGPVSDAGAQLFAGSSADALRTAIAKAAAKAGVPLFSPHDLRHRRVSLLHRQGIDWARIGAFVGQRSLKVTADTYTHVLADERELAYDWLLSARAAGE